MKTNRIKKSILVVALSLLLALTAVFAVACRNNQEPSPATFALTLNATGRGSGTVTVTPNQRYFEEGVSVTVMATPDAGFRFVEWRSGDSAVATTPSHTFNMPNTALTLTAVFDLPSIDFPDYNINEGDGQDYNWRRPEHILRMAYDDGFVIDGVLDEEVWAEQNVFVFERTLGAHTYKMEVTTVFGYYGIALMGRMYHPSGIFFNPAQPIYHNTSIIFSISETSYLTENTIQLRVGANGFQEQWFGLHSYDFGSGQAAYAFSRAHIPSVSIARLVDNNSNTIESDYLGMVNLPHAEYNIRGFDVETFVPWTSIGRQAGHNSSGILVLPELNICLELEGPRAHMLIPEDTHFADPFTWVTFDEDGYNPDIRYRFPLYEHDDAYFINQMINDATEPEFDIWGTPEGLVARQNPVVLNEFGGFRGVTYYAFLHPTSGLHLLMVARTNRLGWGGNQWYRGYHAYIHINGNYNFSVPLNPNATGAAHGVYPASRGNTGGARGRYVPIENPLGARTRHTSIISLRVPRSGAQALGIGGGIRNAGNAEREHVRIGLNFATRIRPQDGGGNLATYESMLHERNGASTTEPFWTPAYPSRYLVNQFFVYRDGLSTELRTDNVPAPGIDIVGGDITQWATRPNVELVDLGQDEEFAMSGINFPTREAGEQRVRFYGFMAPSGLHVAARAYHANHRTGGGRFHYNTNFEFWINGTQHWASNARGPMGSQSEMTTLFPGDPDGHPTLFVSTAFVFIPRELIPGTINNPGTANEHIRLVFAWQTPNRTSGFGAVTPGSPMTFIPIMGTSGQNQTVRSNVTWWTTAYNRPYYLPYMDRNSFFVYLDAMLTAARP